MKFKANILLITLFLLMMSSLSALLVTAYIKNLIKFSAAFHNYYQWYYIANAWLELALVKTNGRVRGFGFEDTVGSWSSTVTNNLSCGTGCYFVTTTTATSSSLTSLNTSDPLNSGSVCNATTVATQWYVIPPWGCVPIILLQDNKTIGVSGAYNWDEWNLMKIDDIYLDELFQGDDPDIYATQWLTALVTDMADIEGRLTYENWYSKSFGFNSTDMQINWWVWKLIDVISKTTLWEAWSADKLILMIANTTNTTGSYCVDGGSNKLATQFITINTQWQYGNTNLKLKWVRKAGLPADFCYTVISN